MTEMITFDWARVVENIATITVPLALYAMANRRKAKKEIDEKHAENVEMFNTLVLDKKFFPPHEHLEQSGALSVTGIRKAPPHRTF